MGFSSKFARTHFQQSSSKYSLGDTVNNWLLTDWLAVHSCKYRLCFDTDPDRKRPGWIDFDKCKLSNICWQEIFTSVNHNSARTTKHLVSLHHECSEHKAKQNTEEQIWIDGSNWKSIFKTWATNAQAVDVPSLLTRCCLYHHPFSQWVSHVDVSF